MLQQSSEWTMKQLRSIHFSRILIGRRSTKKDDKVFRQKNRDVFSLKLVKYLITVRIYITKYSIVLKLITLRTMKKCSLEI